MDPFGTESFLLHDAEQLFERLLAVAGIFSIEFQRVAGGQFLKQGCEDFFAFEFIHHPESGAAKTLRVLVDHAVAEAMEGVNVYLVAIRTDQGCQAFLHRSGAGFGICKAKDIRRFGVCFIQDISDPHSEHLGFSGAGPGDDQYRTFNHFNSPALRLIQAIQ